MSCLPSQILEIGIYPLVHITLATLINHEKGMALSLFC